MFLGIISVIRTRHISSLPLYITSIILTHCCNMYGSQSITLYSYLIQRRIQSSEMFLVIISVIRTRHISSLPLYITSIILTHCCNMYGSQSITLYSYLIQRRIQSSEMFLVIISVIRTRHISSLPLYITSIILTHCCNM